MLQGRDDRTGFRVLAAVSFCHLLNDMLQSAIPSAYPIFKNAYHLDFGQIGVITLTRPGPLVRLLRHVVYAQELMPGRVGAVAGLFFGIAFGIGGIGAALLGQVADQRGIEFVYRVCSFLPAIGLLTALLPDIEGRATAVQPRAVGA